MKYELPRILVAGTGSGCGKTTVTCALLRALKDQGIPLSAFKCGPDYIDPMFHREVLGIPSRNLDRFLCGDAVPYLLYRNTPEGSMAVLEGVMGFYDGIGATGESSTWELSQLLETPVVLVANVQGKALSLAAELKGYLDFLPNRIQGVILNGVTDSSYPLYRDIVRQHCTVEVLGYLPRLPEAELKSRHLGLVTAGEVETLQQKIGLMAESLARTVDLHRLIEIAKTASPLEVPDITLPQPGKPVRIGVAKDEAFCFLYQDNLDLLAELGAELIPFSPLRDQFLPKGIQGLVLPGGYPELYGEQLSQNQSLLQDLQEKIEGGMPTIAECGGFLLLLQSLTTSDDKTYSMTGVLPGGAAMTKRLGRFGYQTLLADRDNLLLRAGESIPAHEFHYSQAEQEGEDLVARKAGTGREWRCIYATETLWAGYPHLHLWGNPQSAARFLEQCREMAQ